MNVSPIGAILGALLMLLICRSLFGCEVRSHQSAKASKRYKAEVPLGRRWLLLDAPRYVRDKYSKLERKVIKATFIVQVLRGMNLTLHALFLPVIVGALLADGKWISRIFFSYILVCGGCIILLGMMEWSFHPNRERVRNGKKPNNW